VTRKGFLESHGCSGQLRFSKETEERGGDHGKDDLFCHNASDGVGDKLRTGQEESELDGDISDLFCMVPVAFGK
jgi:hypothetical protein